MKQLTNKELEEIGIERPPRGSKSPGKYWSHWSRSYIRLPKGERSTKDVLKAIHEAGVKQGIESGKYIRSAEFKQLLNIK